MIRAIDIIDKLPHKTFTTQKAYYLRNRKALERAGQIAYKALFDEVGNCKICGECGRCPGWHTGEEAFNSFIKSQLA